MVLLTWFSVLLILVSGSVLFSPMCIVYFRIGVEYMGFVIYLN